MSGIGVRSGSTAGIGARCRRGIAALCASMAIAAIATGCGGDDDGAPAPPVAILAAFPAELQAVLEHMSIDDTVFVAGRAMRRGHIGDVAVIAGMTGIGLVNAYRSADELAAAFDLRGIVVTGVAGSPFRIGDVIVPLRWIDRDGTTYTADPAWFALARTTAAAGDVHLHRCSERPDDADAAPVCLEHYPAVVSGGDGESDDPFGGTELPCVADGDDVFGCEVVTGEPHPHAPTPAALIAVDEPVQTAVDMETAAVAAVAHARGLPFIAFRAVSDGDGDPLDLPGFPAQFFTYYRLAARNAAAAVAAFVRRT